MSAAVLHQALRTEDTQSSPEPSCLKVPIKASTRSQDTISNDNKKYAK